MGDIIMWRAETASSGIPGRALGRVRTNNFVVDDYASRLTTVRARSRGRRSSSFRV